MSENKIRLCILATVPVSINAFYGDQIDLLCDNGFDVTVVTSPDPALCAKISRRCRLVTIPMARSVSPLADIEAFFRVLSVMRKGRFDLVQYSSPKAALLGSLCAFICRVPARLYLMWGLYYTGQKGLMRAVMKAAERVICAASTDIAPDSEGNRRFAVSEGLCPPGKIGVVGPGSANGVDLQVFDPYRLARAREIVRTRIGAGKDDIVFGFTGRLHRDKGIHELLRAFAGLREKYPAVRLLLVGPDEAKGLESDAAGVLSGEGVYLAGFQDKPEEWMSAMDVFVLPSYREGFGVVNIEASALGIPVISTDIPGPRDSVDNGVSGILVPVASTGALRDAMELMITDPGMRRRLGEEGRRWAGRFERRGLWRDIIAHRSALLRRTRDPGFIYRSCKRVFDLVAASLLIVLLLPVFLAAAVWSLAAAGWPVIFVQERPGYKGLPFRMFKFRTMNDARDASGALLPDGQRLTRAGALLRRSSLDELPGLFNVLKGEMSFVGPRPLLMKYLPLYTPAQMRRHDAVPGLTGWAQVNGRNAISWDEKFSFDIWYVDHRSLRLDFVIIMRTIAAIVTGTGVTQPGSATAEEFTGKAGS